MSITNFEDITRPISEAEVKLVYPIVDGLKKRTVDNPVTGKEMIHGIKKNMNISISRTSLSRIIHFIRSEGILPVIASSKGYYHSYDPEDIKQQIASLEDRASAILHGTRGLRRFISEERNNMVIDRFSGEYSFLSNFYYCYVEYDGVVYRSSEHAYQAAKFMDPKSRMRIRELETPGAAKKVANSMTGIRSDWDYVRVHVMEQILMDKFRRNHDLRIKLLKTGSAELIEGNTWGDTFWGVYKGKGKNYLGKLLMKVRNYYALLPDMGSSKTQTTI